MCLKEDYYSGKGSDMHAAYNVQMAVNRGMIVDFYVSHDRSDTKTFSPFLEKMKRDWGNYPDLVCADSGYGSLANYRFLREHSIGNYVKYTNWEGEVSGRRPALLSLGADGRVTRLNGKEAKATELARHRSFSGSVFYSVDNCRGCQYRKYCRKPLKNKTGKGRVFETSAEYLGYLQRAKTNLLSPKGIELRVNRSVQAEGTFGIIKQDIGYDRFRRTGIDRVRGEMMLVCLGANIRKYLRFLRTGKVPKFWKAPGDISAEKPKKISRVVKKGGISRRNL